MEPVNQLVFYLLSSTGFWFFLGFVQYIPWALCSYWFAYLMFLLQYWFCCELLSPWWFTFCLMYIFSLFHIFPDDWSCFQHCSYFYLTILIWLTKKLTILTWLTKTYLLDLVQYRHIFHRCGQLQWHLPLVLGCLCTLLLLLVWDNKSFMVNLRMLLFLHRYNVFWSIFLWLYL